MEEETGTAEEAGMGEEEEGVAACSSCLSWWP